MTARDVSWPPRVHRQEQAQATFGDVAERLIPALERSDDVADRVVKALEHLPPGERHALIERALAGDMASAPPALLQLIESAGVAPPWLDWARLERANEVFLRPGLLGGLTLGLCSLVHGYSAPAGNKPLAFSGKLKERADRRLAETGKFISAVTAVGGLQPGALGWRLVLHVRLMHAAVRRLVLESGRWSSQNWSHPINQHDMLATILLFSSVFIDGIRRLGVHVTPQEADDYQHLFRWVGELIGVEASLLPTSYTQAKRLADFILLTQGPPDDDSRALVAALLEGPRRSAKTPRELRRAERHVAVASGLCRSLVGDELADGLGLKRDRHRHWASAVRTTLRVLERARLSVPPVNDLVRLLGSRYWSFTVRQGLGGVPARYEMPETLAGVPH